MSSAQRGGIIFRLLFLLLLALLVVVVYWMRHPLLRLAGNWWEVEDRLERADAILVLGDDNFPGDRASRSAELYRAGWAPVVVASGRLLRPYAGIAELIERDLEMRGVPAEAIIRFPQRAATLVRKLRHWQGWWRNGAGAGFCWSRRITTRGAHDIFSGTCFLLKLRS
jgi:uncharacterized SAM-binding protein YcdF (DUF218 family)